MGGVGNGAAEEDWCQDLNPGMAAMLGLFGITQLWWKLGPCSFGVLPFATGLGSRRDLAGKEKGERTLAGGP